MEICARAPGEELKKGILHASIKKRKGKGFWISFLFYGPALLFYIPFFVFPALLTFNYSFTSWNGFQIDAPFVGMANYTELMKDERFLTAVCNTGIYTISLVLINTFAAMILAVLLDNMKRGRGVVRSMFFYPSIMSYLAIGALFTYVFNYNNGILNQILHRLGLTCLAQDWLGNPHLAVWSVVLLTAWGLIGLYTVIYMAALQTIPKELYESAKIDGAGSVRSFLYITYPMLAAATTTCATSALFGSLALFGQILVTTNGGPGYSSISATYLIYWLGMSVNRVGYATAAATVLFIIIMVLTQTATIFLRRREIHL